MFSEMDSLDPGGKLREFSLVFVTANETLSTGGDIHIIGQKTVQVDLLRRRLKDAIFTESLAFKVVGEHHGQPKLAVPKQINPAVRNPNHYDNGTINIMISTSKAIRKVHPRLILYFNDKKVTP